MRQSYSRVLSGLEDNMKHIRTVVYDFVCSLFTRRRKVEELELGSEDQQYQTLDLCRIIFNGFGQ